MSDRPTSPEARRTGLAILLGSALSSQIGAAAGSLAFPTIGAVGVVTVRQFVSAITLLSIARPPLRTFTRRQWMPTIALGLVFGLMNLSLYVAISRIGLGLAVTLEFLGPLGVALAGSRRRSTFGCAALAVVGVVLLTDPRPTTDYLGVGFGVSAALCWAAYILLNREIGRRLPGIQGSAAAAGLSALLFIPVGIVTFVLHPPTMAALGLALCAGLLSSVVPQVADLITLRRLPAHLFGILMSAHPVFAATVGTVALHQRLAWPQWAGIAAIVASNTWSVLGHQRRSRSDADERSVVGDLVGIGVVEPDAAHAEVAEPDLLAPGHGHADAAGPVAAPHQPVGARTPVIERPDH
ncbi:inner membrane transporter RhtA [Nakamurella panacisegetis]|uniref:Inner membrane transporter RhtA n=1 Tax=Nakamurella panacisegetis TaxID=1090615 RepID=A0A1H0N4K2_9ACTN|nr:EamA family transporter [Nakamurella panacisegetis]SDO87608.1 inner membrane transporter RhtA [Nakamurella panacisegetis]